MTEMVERVARAMQEAHGIVGGSVYQRYRSAARAAIGAMREPTPQMIEAGADGIFASIGHDTDNLDKIQDAPEVWRTMIDAALKEDSTC